MKTVIILPTYNEHENLPRLVKAISHMEIEDYSLCVVDDASPDGTGGIAEELAHDYPVEVIHREGKLGLGTAYLAGFRYALDRGADRIITMDVDLSHDPEDVPKLLDASRNADLVIGSRRVEGGTIVGWGLWRVLASRGAMMISRTILGLRAHDVTSGYRCYRRETLLHLPLASIHSNGYSFLEEILFMVERAGMRVVEVPVAFVDRTAGQSKLGTQEIMKFFFTILRLRWKKRPRHISSSGEQSG